MLLRKVTGWAEIGTSGSDKSATVRMPICIHYSLRPVNVNVHQFTVVFNEGSYADGGIETRTPEAQETALRALAGPTSAVTAMRDIWGGSFKGVVVDMGPVREMKFDGFTSPLKTAQVSVREVKYS